MRMRKKAWARPELEACSYFLPEPAALRGSWMSHFGEKRPIHLDLGCGKCVFLAEIAKARPDVNFVGIDLSLDMLGVGRRNIAAAFGEKEPENVLLCAYDITRLGELFAPGEGISRLYINFCNPWPTARGHKRRLTHTRQLLSYRPLLEKGAEIWFKTDDDGLYLATKRYFAEAGFRVIADTRDLAALHDPENFLTEHEILFSGEGIAIKGLKAVLDDELGIRS